MDELLAACENSVAIDFVKQRLNMLMNSHKNALAYRYRRIGKIHWYVSPIPAGADVLQVDRLQNDKHTWDSLTNGNIRNT